MKIRGDGAMLSKIARGTFVVLLAAMVVAWAFSLRKNEAPEPQNGEPAELWNLYA
jgi:hypothetical protein